MNADNPAAARVKRARARDRFEWLAAVNRSPDLSPVQRAVAISIGLRYNITDGRCNPGYDAIANGTPYKRRAVITAVADLTEKGWIAIKPSRGRHCNSFDLTMSCNSAPIDAPLTDEPNSAPEERQPCMVDAVNGARQTAHIIEIAGEKNHNREENIKENREETRDSPLIPRKRPTLRSLNSASPIVPVIAIHHSPRGPTPYRRRSPPSPPKTASRNFGEHIRAGSARAQHAKPGRRRSPRPRRKRSPPPSGVTPSVRSRG